MAERLQPATPLDRREAPEPPACHVLEEDALDRLLRAEREDLLEPGLLQPGHKRQKL